VDTREIKKERNRKKVVKNVIEVSSLIQGTKLEEEKRARVTIFCYPFLDHVTETTNI